MSFHHLGEKTWKRPLCLSLDELQSCVGLAWGQEKTFPYHCKFIIQSNYCI